MKSVLVLAGALLSFTVHAQEIARCIGENGEELIYKSDQAVDQGWCSSGEGVIYIDGKLVGETHFTNCSKRGFFARLDSELQRGGSSRVSIEGTFNSLGEPRRASVEYKDSVGFKLTVNYYCRSKTLNVRKPL